ncbi:hypothetical protein QBC39DRAFT_358718 [Podospora conica]|nr:hypothetical protein QBC39DRAFT_358718 [Schizothecium conicum]
MSPEESSPPPDHLLLLRTDSTAPRQAPEKHKASSPPSPQLLEPSPPPTLSPSQATTTMPPSRKRSNGGLPGPPPAKRGKSAATQLPDNNNPAANDRPAAKGGAEGSDYDKSDMAERYHQAGKSFWEKATNLPTPPGHGVVSEGEFDAMIEPPPLTSAEDALWPPHREQQLQQDWKTDPLRSLILKETENTLKEHKVLWKSCCQYFRCTPLDIIGDPILGSKYRLATDQTGQRKVPMESIASLPYAPFWSTTSCNALNDILWHPMWRDGDVASLALAIQFAVIARTDDRGSWTFDNPTDSRFVDSLRLMIDGERGLPIPERSKIGNLCRRSAAGHPGRRASDWYMLFDGIFSLYEGRGRQPTPTGAVYMVKSDDLVAIKTALAGVGGYGLPSPVDTNLYRVTFGVKRQPKTAPVGLAQFKSALCTVALNFRRRQLIHQLASEAAANGAAAPVGGGDEDEDPMPSPGADDAMMPEVGGSGDLDGDTGIQDVEHEPMGAHEQGADGEGGGPSLPNQAYDQHHTEPRPSRDSGDTRQTEGGMDERAISTVLEEHEPLRWTREQAPPPMSPSTSTFPAGGNNLGGYNFLPQIPDDDEVFHALPRPSQPVSSQPAAGVQKSAPLASQRFPVSSQLAEEQFPAQRASQALPSSPQLTGGKQVPTTNASQAIPQPQAPNYGFGPGGWLEYRGRFRWLGEDLEDLEDM